MAHNRTSIRDALGTLLQGMATPLNVYVERRVAIDTTLRPCAILSVGEDSAEAGEMTMGSPTYGVETTQTCIVELHADGANGEGVCATLDQMELECEQLIATDLTLGGLVEMIYPTTSELETNSDQDRIQGVRTLTYLAPWRHTFGSPDIAET